MRCFMATAEECRQALEDLTGRIAEMDEADRQAHLVDREISCTVSDLGVTFVTRIGPNGATPVLEANGSEPPAQVRFTAKSDDLIAIAGRPHQHRACLADRPPQGGGQHLGHPPAPQGPLTR